MKILYFKYAIQIILSITIFLGLTSCEDVIDVELESGKTQLVVDAFVNDLPENQKIRLTLSAPYFQNQKTPPALNAVVRLIDNNGKVFNFLDLENNGNYIYERSDLDSFCVVGNSYRLEIEYDGETYFSESRVNPIPEIDSMISKKDKNPFSGELEYKAEYFATDFRGTRDYYYVRAWYNDTLKALGNSDKFQDGAFSGSGADGLVFTLPMRECVNRQGEPYFPGDTIRMQLLSVDEGTYLFLNDVFRQLNNGGLFATPLANARTNIKNVNPNSSKTAIGYFVTSAAKTAGVRIKE